LQSNQFKLSTAITLNENLEDEAEKQRNISSKFEPVIECVTEKIINPIQSGAVGEDFFNRPSPCVQFTNVVESEIRGSKPRVLKYLMALEKREQALLNDPEIASCKGILLKRNRELMTEGMTSDETEANVYNCLIPMRCSTSWKTVNECLTKNNGAYQNCHFQLVDLYNCAVENGMLESKKEMKEIQKLPQKNLKEFLKKLVTRSSSKNSKSKIWSQVVTLIFE